jgi:hypothetical protein
MYNHRLELAVKKNTTIETDDKTKRKLELEGHLVFLDSDGETKDSVDVKMSISGNEDIVAPYLDGYAWIGTKLGGTLHEMDARLDQFVEKITVKLNEIIESSLEGVGGDPAQPDIEDDHQAPPDKTIIVSFREIADTDEKAKEKIIEEMRTRDDHGQSKVSVCDLLDELAIDEEDRVYIQDMIGALTLEDKLLCEEIQHCDYISLLEEDDVDTTGLETDLDDEADPNALEEPEPEEKTPVKKAKPQNPHISNRCKKFESIDGVKVKSGTIDHSCTKCDFLLEDGTCDEGIPIEKEVSEPATDPRSDITDEKALAMASELLELSTETNLKFSIIASNMHKVHAGKGFSVRVIDTYKHLVKADENWEGWLSDQVAEGRMSVEEQLGRQVFKILKPYKFPTQIGFEDTPKKKSRRKKE